MLFCVRTISQPVGQSCDFTGCSFPKVSLTFLNIQVVKSWVACVPSSCNAISLFYTSDLFPALLLWPRRLSCVALSFFVLVGFNQWEALAENQKARVERIGTVFFSDCSHTLAVGSGCILPKQMESSFCAMSDAHIASASS